MSRFGAVSGHGIEPCPGSLRAVSRSGRPVFSEVTMLAKGARWPCCAYTPPNSDSAYSAPASHSRCRSATHWAPKRLPASSSAVASRTKSRLSGTPARLIASIPARWRIPVDFMSRAPRP